jgi:uncharacterized protein YraI
MLRTIVSLLAVVMFLSMVVPGATLNAAAPDFTTESTALTFTSWTAEYFNNRTFTAPGISGSSIPAGPLALNWGTAAPISGINADEWSARFTSVVNFPLGGNVIFRAKADDTVTVRVDGTAVTASAPYFIDQEYVGSIYVTPGSHIVVVDYTDIADKAYLYVSWQGGGIYSTSGVTGTVQTSSLNFRNGPGLTYARIGSLSFGETYSIQGRNGAGTWAYFEAKGQVGWAYASLMAFTGNFLSLPIVEGTTTDTVTPPGGIVLEALPTYNMRIRSCPSTTCAKIGLVPWQNSVGVYGQSTNGQWIMVRYISASGSQVIGWSSKQYYRLVSNPSQSLPSLPVVQ